MHMPEMCVHSAMARTEAWFFSPWAAELWSGQATGARGEVVRKERVMAQRQTAKGTAMRAEEITGMGLRLATPSPLPLTPTPVNHFVATPGTQTLVPHWFLLPLMPNPRTPHPFQHWKSQNPGLLG